MNLTLRFQNSLIDAIISINSSDDEEEDYPTPIERKISPTPPPVQSKPKRKTIKIFSYLSIFF